MAIYSRAGKKRRARGNAIFSFNRSFSSHSSTAVRCLTEVGAKKKKKRSGRAVAILKFANMAIRGLMLLCIFLQNNPEVVELKCIERMFYGKIAVYTESIA